MPGARDISLFQRLIMAIIPEDGSIQGSGDMEFEAYRTGFELDEEMESNSLANHDSFQFVRFSLSFLTTMILRIEHKYILAIVLVCV